MKKSAILAAAAVLGRDVRRPRDGAGSRLQSRLLRAILSKEPTARTKDPEIPIPAATSVRSTATKPTGTMPTGAAHGKTAITAGTTTADSGPAMSQPAVKGRHRRRHRHGPLRQRRLCPPERLRVHPRHLVPRRRRPDAYLPVREFSRSTLKGGQMAAFYRLTAQRRTRRFWPFADKSDIRPAEDRPARSLIAAHRSLQFAGLAQR